MFGGRLKRALILRISKDGFNTQEITITTGPFEWIGLTGKHHGNYFLLRADHFHIKLEPIQLFSDKAFGSERVGPIHPRSLPQGEGASEPASGTVAISSDPPNAEIFIDGNFAGQTPSTIPLRSGTHHIEVRTRGKQSWQRDLQVGKDSHITLHPVLDDPQR